ncbi:iron-containing alcohol dehydrogenase [Natrialbaceae archaeon AArc-T1-2]|uniref:iron-containing alcohol dehydrogenase n=1 Tax=Natrialbaceae archaeon AArc-T1-2 TaxID=3053904 RepID=UPI00255AEDD7|nr:iron-containing alcohol dehydrogenase [Natrialbaceae archaeon AArc-T1-2]WIV68176.1 iron-containing alcohol dehydrogenase [Natrialbaceae archaeon AArc-T1-2]
MEHPTPTHGTRLIVSPSQVVVGAGAVEEVGDYADLYGSRALLIATEMIDDIHGDAVREHLSEAGIETVSYTDVRPDPTVENIESAYELWQREECDVIVTLGGGSSIDAGKGVGILAANEGSIRDFGVDRAGYEGVPNPTPPLLAVNTTAGTGSEATRSVVVTDESTDTKFLIVSKNVVPDVAVEDPELTLSLPQSHTAFTGIDALTHAIEAYVSVKSYSVPQDFARSAIRRIGRWMPIAWANGDDLEARTEMMIGQLQAGQAFTNSSVALVHGMARPLGAQLHIPHGLANAILLPYVMEFSAMAAPEEYAEIARLMDAADPDDTDREAAEKASEAVLELCEDVSLASYLDDFGEIPSREEYVDAVGKMAQDAIDSGSPDNNPRKPTREELEELFVTVYDDALAPDSPRRS